MCAMEEPANRKSAGKKRKPNSGSFKPGQSGNPSGRAKIPEDVKAAFKELTPQAVATLKGILLSDTSKDSDKIKAAEIILDRGYGKPAQALDVDVNSLPQVIFAGEEDVPQ